MKIVLIAPNVSLGMGGEAIKAYQYFQYLLAEGYDAYLCTHERCRDDVVSAFAANRLIFVADDALSVFLWKSRILRPFLNMRFQSRVKAQLVDLGHSDAIWHFLTPISPVEPKFYPKGQRVVIGPLSGNVYYPQGFRSRMQIDRRLAHLLHRPSQWLFGTLFKDKRRADVVLNSGYKRTRQSLHWAGVSDSQIMEVVDSALPSYVNEAEPITHAGANHKFVSLGRFVDDKGHDLAIRALALCPEPITLTIYGQGDDGHKLRQLAQDLGVQDRVIFSGWLKHADIAQVMSAFRGFIFPSLAEANGIVMQEMMMLGVPVVALDWGGPAALAPHDAAVFVDPQNADFVVEKVSQAMVELSGNPDFANAIASRARLSAQGRFSWDVVGKSWAAAYDRIAETRPFSK